MTGVYLRCDKCRATLGVEQVITSRELPIRPMSTDVRELIDAARQRGWTGPLARESNDEDRCPACSRADHPAFEDSPSDQAYMRDHNL